MIIFLFNDLIRDISRSLQVNYAIYLMAFETYKSEVVFKFKTALLLTRKYEI